MVLIVLEHAFHQEVHLFDMIAVLQVVLLAAKRFAFFGSQETDVVRRRSDSLAENYLSEIFDRRLFPTNLTKVKVVVFVRDDGFLRVKPIHEQLDFGFALLGGLVQFTEVDWRQSWKVEGVACRPRQRHQEQRQKHAPFADVAKHR